MKATIHILLSVLLLISAGCANMSKRTKCICASAAVGAVIGGGAGAAIGNQGDTDNRAEGSAIGTAAGALIGGGLGLILCKGEVDTDGDGVIDSLDKCPNTPIGVEVDANGCPIDSDGDGVPDYKDKCPDTPKGVKVDENGCPPVGEELLILQGINFLFDSARIRKDSAKTLDVAVETLTKNPNIKVEIEGHTCSKGSKEYNLGLSQRRADAVREYLISKGIAGERLSTVGKGEEDPIASNDTMEERSKNRRIEFVVTSK